MLHLGFDVGGTNVAAGLVDDDNNIVCKRSRRFPKGKGGEGLSALLRQLAEELCRDAGVSADSLSEIGVALPGTLDKTRQTVIDAHNLGFHQTPLADLVRERFPQAGICLLNDADAATLAEFKAGVLQGCRTGLLLTLGTGLGGGLILNGELFPGGLGRGVELGHMLLHAGGRRCTCGQRGCAECYCSATALARAGRRSLAHSPQSLLAEKCKGRQERVTAKLVTDCAELGDPVAVKLFDEYIDELAAFLSSLVNLADPEIMAIGGGLGQSGEALCGPLRQRTAERCFYHSCGQILPAALGNDAGIVGAALAPSLTK